MDGDVGELGPADVSSVEDSDQNVQKLRDKVVAEITLRRVIGIAEEAVVALSKDEAMLFLNS